MLDLQEGIKKKNVNLSIKLNEQCTYVTESSQDVTLVMGVECQGIGVLKRIIFSLIQGTSKTLKSF